MISREEVLADNVAHLVALIQGESIDSPHEYPHCFIEWLWLNDPSACEKMILDSMPEWKTIGNEIFRAIYLASEHLNQEDFLQLIFNCSINRSVNQFYKTQFLALLMKKGYPQAVSRYKKSFKAKVQSITQGRTECIPSNVMPSVHDACRFQIDTLVPEFRQLEEVCKPLVSCGQLWPYALHAVQAAIIMFEEGGEQLRKIASDDSVNTSLREQIVYCIGCLRENTDFVFLKELYWRRFDDDLFQLQSQIIDSLAYIGSGEEVSTFLVEAIDERLNFGKGWFRNVDRYFNVFAETAYYAGKKTPDLVERLIRLSEAKDILLVSAPAWIALEKIGYLTGPVPNRLEKDISTVRSLIEGLVVSDALKVHRRHNYSE